MAVRRFLSTPQRKSTAMKKCIIDYGTKTGPIRAYAPRPAHQMPTGRRRRRVRGYSPDARRRLRQEIHRLAARWEKLRPIFITLTLPGKDWEQIDYKAAFKRWRERLRALIPGVWGFWVIEYQKRGAVHYHLALDHEAVLRVSESLDALRQWVSQSWYESVGSGQEDHLKAGTNVRSFKDLPGYLAKEMSKHLRQDADNQAVQRHTGRFWGKIGKGLIKAHQIENKREVTEAEFRHFQEVREGYWRPRCVAWARKSGRAEEGVWLPNYLPSATLLDQGKRDPSGPSSRRCRSDRPNEGFMDTVRRCKGEAAVPRWFSENEREGKPVLLQSVLDGLGRVIREEWRGIGQGWLCLLEGAIEGFCSPWAALLYWWRS